jgi:hypothetical protein
VIRNRGYRGCVVGWVSYVCGRKAYDVHVWYFVVFPCVGLKDRGVCPHKTAIRAHFV